MPLDSRHPECPDAEQLAAFADGGLSPEQRTVVEAHVAACEDCYEALAEILAIVTALETPAAPALPGTVTVTTSNRRSIVWIGGTLAAAAAVILLINVWPAARPDALQVAIGTLANAQRDSRLGLGRLSIDRRHAPSPVIVRSGGQTADSFAVRSAAQQLKLTASTDGSRSGLHAYSLALFASGERTAAVETLEKALREPGPDEAVLRSDLSAMYLEQYGTSGAQSDAERALQEAERALAASPQHLAALFNRAHALDRLGRPDARLAWQTYIDLDRDPASGWRAEAIQRRDAPR